ncbi:uncharacterized protein LOC107767842 isoform X2 [Nicotiana tabacum]|uniref:Uncharacterized protein LOC107767842 isoform X2 n=1 Tax=Nicotiana tabacum TaxID=4097 RepID=A0A1S3XR45_TOBAC|nr:PREDICTED: uncharacterized protein LOC107767842 isoform X2 [Nicotiana tabacum]XP_018629503.1 uncharacterized protein LOC104105707 isoform X2 [Nicotiana tomentosiformis]
MVHFKDHEIPYPYLEIAENKKDPYAKVLQLKTNFPMIRAFPLIRQSPDSLLNLSEWSTKEEFDILENFFSKATNTKVLLLKSSTHDHTTVSASPKPSDEGLASWSCPHSGFGEVQYTPCYWEWVEDTLRRNKAFCELWHRSTNSACTSIGEISISLWDSHVIGGLPIHGIFYDELVPSAQELMQAYQHGKPFLPKTCAYLLLAFYRLSDGDSKEVSVRDWVSFWFKGPNRYKEPPQRVSNNELTSQGRVTIHIAILTSYFCSELTKIMLLLLS